MRSRSKQRWRWPWWVVGAALAVCFEGSGTWLFGCLAVWHVGCGWLWVTGWQRIAWGSIDKLKDKY
eukprot:gnl/Chilomastix_caulleri/3363.p2 GENE.gnl/Chilomastix_caulleri/3363~~gnl/Chilomastix_caulleri/3363.p2  ORF type:complete len:66 (+),score=11.37 gnl/Chilomastix_caulleri/3363:210-407(+)